MVIWRRTCQECGQVLRLSYGQRPTGKQISERSFTERKCRKCKSASLDIGYEETDGNPNEDDVCAS